MQIIFRILNFDTFIFLEQYLLFNLINLKLMVLFEYID